MTQLCDECLRPIKPFELCDHGSGEGGSARFDGHSGFESGRSAAWLLVSAPLGGLALDWVVPLWSTMVSSFVLCLVGSIPFAYAWSRRQIGRGSSFSTQIKALGRGLLPPVAMRSAFTRSKFATLSTAWGVALVVTVLAIQAVATPANMTGLNKRISSGVSEKWNIGVAVKCKGPALVFPGSNLNCKVSKRILLEISLPAGVKIKNWFGDVSWNVSSR